MRNMVDQNREDAPVDALNLNVDEAFKPDGNPSESERERYLRAIKGCPMHAMLAAQLETFWDQEPDLGQDQPDRVQLG